MLSSPSLEERIALAIQSATDYEPHKFRHWVLNKRITSPDQRCPFCHVELATIQPRQVVVNLLVPRIHGGSDDSENHVVCCLLCARSKSYNDLLAWAPFKQLPEAERAPLLARRSAILLHSRNHLGPHSRNADRSTVTRHLEKRFTFPRFLAFAVQGLDCSWIGWHDKTGASQAHDLAAVLLRFQAQASPVSSSPITLFQVDNSAFLDVVWALIEHHALVQPLTIPDLTTPTLDLTDWRHCWTRTFAGLRDLTRRYSLLDREVATSKPVELSQSYGAVWARKKKEAVAAPLRKANDRRAWLQAKADYDSRMKFNGANGMPRMSAMEIVEARLEILRLECIYKGIEFNEKAPG